MDVKVLLGLKRFGVLGLAEMFRLHCPNYWRTTEERKEVKKALMNEKKEFRKISRDVLVEFFFGLTRQRRKERRMKRMKDDEGRMVEGGR